MLQEDVVYYAAHFDKEDEDSITEDEQLVTLVYILNMALDLHYI